MSTRRIAQTSLAAIVVMLTGCGGEDNPAAPAAPAPPPPPAAQPPAAPTGLSAASTGTTATSLSWTDASDNETGFQIERGLSSTGPFSRIASTGPNDAMFSDSGLTDETEYCYQVRATNGEGESDFTAVSCATTDAQPDPFINMAVLNTAQILPDLVTATCGPIDSGTDPNTPLWLVPISEAEAGNCDVGNIFPVTAPDAHHITLGEWSTAAGSVTITCLHGGGTQFDFSFTGLVPDGVFTVWHFMVTGGGALASHPPADINNVFTADATGSADFSTVGTEGAMTFFGSAPSCQLPVPFQGQVADGVTMVILYHTDDMTWGVGPGPEHTGAAQMIMLGL